MLATARQHARLAPRCIVAASAFCQALPAESSRQAQVRSVQPSSAARASVSGCGATSSTSRSYASAAALAASSSEHAQHAFYQRQASSRSIDGHSDSASPSATTSATAETGIEPSPTLMTTPTTTSPPPPFDPDLDAPLTPVERFRRQYPKDPTGALLALRSMSPDELHDVTRRDIGALLFQLTKAVKESPAQRQRASPEVFTAAFRVVRGVLHSLATVDTSARDAFIGKRLRGDLLRGLLRNAVLFGCSPFAVELFTERLDAQLRSPASGPAQKKMVDVDGFAQDLAAAREWGVVAALFSSGPSAQLPKSVFTPTVVATAMAANLHLNRPSTAVKLFSYLDGTPDAGVYHALVQAHLQLGNVQAARDAVVAATEAGTNEVELQLAILRGYRTLGYDAGVEARARRDLARLGLLPQAAFLNALVRLRIDAGDLEGAEAILAEFDLFGTGTSTVRANDDTAVVALSLASRLGDVDRVSRLWHSIASRPEVVSDVAVAQLCRALARLGRTDEAVAILQAAVLHEPSSDWALPPSFVPGIKTANVVLEIATKAHAYDGLAQVAALMRAGGIAPDSHTVTVVLEFARQNLVSSPQNLARLLNEMLSRTDRTGSGPTVHQLDVVLGEAVRTAYFAAKRGKESKALYPAPGHRDTTDPTGGVEPRGELRGLLQNVIRSLRDQGHKGSARSLANRILYDSLALDATQGIPAARKVWHALVLRGYRPSHQHFMALLRGYVHAGAMREAEDIVALASESGIPTSRDMLVTLMAGWGGVGDISRARQTYERIRHVPSELDAKALSTIVRAYVANGSPDAAVRIAREDFPNVTPDAYCIACVAHAIRRANDPPGAIFFVATATRVQGGQVSPEGVARAMAVKAAAESAEQSKPKPKVKKSPESHQPNAEDSVIGWTLDRELRALLRKALNYLSKRSTRDTARAREAVLLAQTMLAYDEGARATRGSFERTRSLGRSERRRIVGQFCDPAVHEGAILRAGSLSKSKKSEKSAEKSVEKGESTPEGQKD